MPSLRWCRALAVSGASLALAACPVTAGLATAASVSPASVAHHHAHHFGMLPPVGAEIPSSMVAMRSVIEYQGRDYAVDLRGGIRQRVDESPYDPYNSVQLRTVGFHVSGQSDTGATVTFERSDADPDARSMLRLTPGYPPRYVERDVIPFTATFQRPGEEPVVLQSREPMVLEATLTRYPAEGHEYRLVRPVELVNPEDPDTVVARLVSFPSHRGVM